MSDAFAHLSDGDYRRAEALADRFAAAGAEEPEEWALSEVEDDIPQLARFLLLRRLWRSAESWKTPPADWFADRAPEPDEGDEGEPVVDTAPVDEEDGDPPFLAAQQAVQRILAAGADPEDLKEVARAVFLYTAFDAMHTIDDGHDPRAGDGMPGWLLAEVSGDLVTTGRVLDNLHEDLLTTEP